ncbi:histone-lysine N-methyltransferase SUV39H2-like [Argiope bruennichi]|uniref:histone-lysine N-methyltransferase SUV39H2-like n=1 Tax=Argiope bruennichi TaxID=94029 RepID=UPI0024944F0F|nr:histone-lysine N-methyltransferase SUV39H2-like [Argiope bruennichi]
MSLKEDIFNVLDNKPNISNLQKFIRNVNVKCLQTLEDLKKTCDKLGIKFVGYSKDMFKVDLILDDEVIQNQKFYFVKWRGHSNKYNSWEPASRLTDSEDLLSYYSYLNSPPAVLSEEIILYFIKDLMIREPYDILTITKLYALIYGFDEEYIDSLGLTFADLKRKILKDFTNSVNKLCEIKDELLYVMKFSEKRKAVLSRLKEWEIEINSNSSVHVKVENNVDLTGPPGNFQFINNYISTCVDLTENPVVFCSCVDCYENQMECCSYNLDGNFAYNKKQCLQLPTGHPIYECNKLCKCDKNCINRVVQHGPKVKVAIFRTKNGCGWGLKTLEFIQKGQFVLEYLGEIITSEQAEQRGEVYFHLGRTYLFDMGFEGDCYYTIDAMLFGNASHFINHSCNPNLATYSVWINQQDPKLPRIALFAKKKIQPGEELTFDYKIMVTPCEYDVYVPKEDLILCKCNSKNCRKYLS